MYSVVWPVPAAVTCQWGGMGWPVVQWSCLGSGHCCSCLDVHELSDSLSVTRSYYSQASNIVRVPSSIDITRSPVDPAQSGLYVENIISSHTSCLQHPCRPGLCLSTADWLHGCGGGLALGAANVMLRMVKCLCMEYIDGTWSACLVFMITSYKYIRDRPIRRGLPSGYHIHITVAIN